MTGYGGVARSKGHQDGLLALGRITTEGRRLIPQVDGLRFVAIAIVVLFHLKTSATHYAIVLAPTRGISADPSALERAALALLEQGAFGVQLFFVLSGFLLALPFAKWRLGLGREPSLKTYFARRLSRLEPPYIVAMVLIYLANVGLAAVVLALARAGVRSTSLKAMPELGGSLAASLFYVHNLVFGEHSRVNPIAWSLEVEVQFYVLAPVLAAVFGIASRGTRRGLLLVLIVAIPILRALGPVAALAPFRVTGLHGFIEFFLAGFLLADLYLSDWRESPATARAWDIASLAGWGALAALLLSGRAVALRAPAVLLAYVGAFRGTWSSWLFSRPWITVLGGMCYSIYLLHYFVILMVGAAVDQLFRPRSFAAHFATQALIAIPLVTAVSVIYFKYLERPCMDPGWPARALARVRRFGPWAHYGP